MKILIFIIKALLSKKTYFLPFRDISDLTGKIDKIKMAHEVQSKIFKKSLDDKRIEYKPIGDYSIAIDTSLLSEEDTAFIKNQRFSIVDETYRCIGVIKCRD